MEAAGIEPAQGSSREPATQRRPPRERAYTKRAPRRATRHDCIVRWFLAVVAMAAIVAASPLAASDPWGPLRRPLTVPRIEPGTPCPVSQVDTSVNFAAMGVGQGLGRGPAYPVGLDADGTMTLAPADNFNSREWMGQKVLWFVPSRYRGPVLIRGRQLDGAYRVRFQRGDVPALELRLAPRQSVSWSGKPRNARGNPSFTRLRAAGCYGYQVDGQAFSYVVVFRAEVES